MSDRFLGWYLRLCLVLLCVVPLVLAGRQVKRVATVAPSDCLIGVGDNLDLCAIWHHPEGGLVLEFGRPVKTAFFWVIGEDGEEPRVDVWLRRQDVGDLDKAVEPRPPVINGIIYTGKGYDPGFVAVRVVGTLFPKSGIEDIAYCDRN